VSDRTRETDTAEQLQRLCRWMGWAFIGDLAPEVRAELDEAGLGPLRLRQSVFSIGLHGDDTSAYLYRGIGWPERWNPFSDANADVQVLARAREVWTTGIRTKREAYPRWVALTCRLHDQWATRNLYEGWDAQPLLYQTGDYARAVLKVLDAYGGTTEDGRDG